MQFGFRIARVQGWLTGVTGVWMEDELPAEDVVRGETKKAEQKDQRLGLCCTGCIKCAQADVKKAAKLLQQ